MRFPASIWLLPALVATPAALAALAAFAAPAALAAPAAVAALAGQGVAQERSTAVLPVPGTPSGCRGSDGHAAAFDGRRTFLLQPGHLSRVKARLASDAAVAAAYADLRTRADQALGRGPYTVADKLTIPPSGDRRDYVSLAPYWWPDPNAPKGSPYVRRDGEFNPERLTARFDVADLQAMSTDVETLGLAYYFSEDRRYAEHAAKLLRTWFIDLETRMNPRLDFAQIVPGRENGRPEGIIDTNRLSRVVEAIGLLGPSGALGAREQEALRGWFAAYVDWLLTSPNGRKEAAAENNHSIWYDSQLAHFALFAGKPEIARKVASEFPERRIVRQFEPDGRLPKELSRTRSLHYSVFTLEAAYDVADLGRCVGIDLWRWKDGEGRGLESATRFVASYVGRVPEWPYREIAPDERELNDLMVRASWAWNSPALAKESGSPALTLRYPRRERQPR